MFYIHTDCPGYRFLYLPHGFKVESCYNRYLKKKRQKTRIAWNGLQSLTNTACSDKGKQIRNYTFFFRSKKLHFIILAFRSSSCTSVLKLWSILCNENRLCLLQKQALSMIKLHRFEFLLLSMNLISNELSTVVERHQK